MQTATYTVANAHGFSYHSGGSLNTCTMMQSNRPDRTRSGKPGKLVRVCRIQMQAAHFEGLDEAKVILLTKASKSAIVKFMPSLLGYTIMQVLREA